VAEQTTRLAKVQTPAWHESPSVHPSPSLQLVPFAAGGLEHTPVPGSHSPTTWHASLALQMTAFANVQDPAWQVSSSVHALPSLQVVPFTAAGFEHNPVDGLHVPAT
jgi:hypothetical protein